MKADENIVHDDALVLVFQRNEFYRKKYHFTLGVYFLSIIVNLTLVGIIIYLYMNPTEPLYFATDSVGRLIQETPLQSPNMSPQEVSAWAVEAVQAAYSYDFMNYRSQLQDAQKYFTDFGWRSYMRGLEESNNLVALTSRKFVAIAKVIAPPKLLREGLLNNTYAWKYELRVLVTYWSPPYDDSPKSKFNNSLVVTMVMKRQNILQSYKGLGIVQLIAVMA